MTFDVIKIDLRTRGRHRRILPVQGKGEIGQTYRKVLVQIAVGVVTLLVQILEINRVPVIRRTLGLI